MNFKKLLILLISVFCSVVNSQNLLSNGDFESGGNGTGFNINGAGYTLISAPFAGTTVSGNYAFTTNPLPMNTANFIAGGDHTSGTGNMMVIDGNSIGGSQRFWRAGNTGGGVCGLTIGQAYTFSYWIKSVSTNVVDPATQANIGIQFNNTSSNTLLSGNVLAPLPASGWQKVTYSFVPNNTCVNIELWNNNTGFVGNDFAVDDFRVSILAPLTVTYSASNPTCPNAANGCINVYGVNGITPYVSYSLSGTASATNTSGIFTGLLPGTYNISVTDSAIPAATATINGIVISNPINPLIVTPNSTFCPGDSVDLSVSGSSTGYSWTASPADSTLTMPNSATPTVSPTVTTTYTVSSTIPTTIDLISNGNFSQGNQSFTSDYQYLTTSTATGVQGAYGIVTNPSAWFTPFSNCPDHTSGTGNMMVIDGSIVNSGNDRIWCQNVTVTPGLTYTFSYWVQSVAAGNPSNLEVLVNGTSIGIDTAPATVCGWIQKTYTWNSGASTSAQICMYDRNILLTGNDFALDDISFTTTINCTYTKTVTLTLGVIPTATIPTTITVCPNVPSVINITGTPNAIVTLLYNGTTPLNGFLNASGTGTITIPALSVTTVFTLSTVSIFGGCTNSNPVGSLNAIVVPNGCAVVGADDGPNLGGGLGINSNICGVGDCRTLTATFSDVASTSSYAVSSIPFCPQAAFENPSWFQIGPGNGVGDDNYAAPFSFPAGMQFCFFGNNYNQLNVGTNGVIVFPNPGTFAAGAYCPWSYNTTIPNAGFPIKNGILGVYQDTDFSVTPPAGVQINVNYQVVGTYPCRKFIANFTNTPQFSCGNNIGLSTTQMVLYEVSNIIEVYVLRRTACTGWNGGRGTIGVINSNGTLATAAPGRNAVAFSTDPTPTNSNNGDNVSEAWRFTPTGPNVPVNFQWLENGAPFSSNPVITVCPTADVTYTAEATYNVCGVPQIATFDVPLYFNANNTQPPQNISQCSNTFDLTVNTATVLGALNPIDYTITYYTTALAAQNGFPALTMAEAMSFVSSGQTIYMNIYDNNSNCTYFPQFDLIIVSTVSPTVTCGTTTTTSIDFTWTALAGATGYTISYQVNSTPIVTVGPNGTATNYTVTGLNSGDTVTITVLPTGGSSSCFTSSTISCVTDPCPTITNPTGNQTLCLNADPAPIAVDTNETIASGISFVYFTTQQTGSGMYAGGTLLNNVTPIAGVASYDMPVLGSAGSLPNTFGTYYVYALLNPTPTSVTCRPTQEIIIIINNGTTPTFPAVGPICNGDALTALPTTSNEGITGAWSPALDNTTTTTYTFTPDTPSQCGSIVTLTITVNPIVTPTFTQVVAICNGGTLTALPTISNNGITGTWSPALDNTTTTTYTFTPDTPSQCGTTTTMTITVNPTITPTFTQVAAICNGATLSALPTTSNNGITGTWSPALDNTATTTYTFTPDTPSQCGTTTTMTITVNPTVIPIFTQVAPICSGTALSALPTTSNNGITGAWSPALDNTTTTTYTFTPDTPSQCGTTTTMTITVNPTITSTFTQVATICSVTALSPLPSTSNNGITGTWSPALNNTATTTYTFTPDNPSQCGTTATMTITVNPIVTPTFTQVAPICNGGTLSALPTTSNNGITGSWSPALDNTATTTYTFTPNNAAQCGTTTTMTIIVNQPPVANQPPTNFQCSNGPSTTAQFNLSLNDPAVTGGVAGLTVSYYTSLAFAQAGTPQISSTNYTGTDFEIVYIRVENNSTGCFSTTTVELRVTQGPVANQPTPYELCDVNTDGLAIFDLTSYTNFITGGDPNVSISFHETQQDAINAASPIQTPGAYQNINQPNQQTIYVRVFYPLTGCANYVTLQLIVNPTPQPITPVDYPECDDNYDGFTIFNLTSIEPEILGTAINPATTTVTYYHSEADANVPTGAIGNPGNYPNATINTETVWVRVETTTPATGCYKVVPLVLVVDPKPTIPAQGYFDQYTLCDDDADGYQIFDLQSQENAGSNILQGQLGTTVTWYPSYALAVSGNNANAITNITAYQNTSQFVQTLGVVLTNTFGCSTISTMDIRVEPLPVLVPPTQPYTICSEDQNGYAQFDLTTLNAALLAGGNYTLHYYTTLTNALDNDLPYEITDVTTYTNATQFIDFVWVTAVSNTNGCQSVLQIELNVNPSPMTPSPDLEDIVVCDEDANTQDGMTNVNLTVRTADALANQPLASSSYSVTYYTTQTDAEATPATNQIIPTLNYPATNGQTIWVRIQNTATSCFEITSFDIIIDAPLALTQPTALKICDNMDANPNDGFATFDLTIKNNEITAGSTGYTINYYSASPVVAANLINTPTAYPNNVSGTQTLGVEVIDIATGCKSYTVLNIRVLSIPTPRENPPVLTPKCEDAINSGVQRFDVTQNATFIQNNNSNVTLHYFYTSADANAVPPVNEIMTPTAVLIGDPALGTQTPRLVNELQYVYVIVQNNVNPGNTNLDNNGQTCYKIVAQPFIINPLPNPVAIGERQICEEDATGNDGFEEFDLTNYISDILNDPSNTTVPATTYTVNFYTDAGHNNLIGTPTAYTNTSNPQTIYVEVIANNTYLDPVSGITNTTNCPSYTSFDIRVYPKPDIAPPTAPLSTCDDDGLNNGYYLYDLTTMNTDILAGQDPALFTVNYYETPYDPNATPPLDPAPIDPATAYNAYTHTIYAAVINNLTSCYKTEAIDLNVEQNPEPFIINNPKLNTICVDFVTNIVVRPLLLQSINNTEPYLNPALQPNYTYQWYQDGVAIPAPEGTAGPTYLVDGSNGLLNNNTSSIFNLEMISTNPLMCSGISPDFVVLQSGQAVIQAGTVGYTVTNAFTDNQTITVTVDGYGISTYQYSLDDGPRQDSPIFNYVSVGEHTIYVWDNKGGFGSNCDVFVINQVQTIDYPLYFTPNGDGIHDTWNIQGLQRQPTAKIYVFDRFGKLIKQLSPTNDGWDGTYNGQPLPSTDYWFTVDYSEQNASKQFRAHFSLKR